MSGRLGRSVEDRRSAETRRQAEGKAVVRAVDFHRRGRNLEQTPGLVDADVADDDRRVHAGVGVGLRAQSSQECRRSATSTQHARVERVGEVEHLSAPEHGRIIETDGGRHAVAELRGVLDVVDAGGAVRAADEERVRLTGRKTRPGRRIS
ncbi:hypothetical protein ES703_76957 [subsurface metagenome]